MDGLSTSVSGFDFILLLFKTQRRSFALICISFLTVSKDYSKVINEHCGTKLQKEISAVDLSLTTANVSPNCFRDGDPHIKVELGKDFMYKFHPY